MDGIDKHNEEIRRNLSNWEKKPILRSIYHNFYELIASQFVDVTDGGTSVELGSGIGNIREVVSNCIRTDLFPNPWLDRVENAYKLSFNYGSISNVVLFDVFHHLEYPGAALDEMWRVLKDRGRLIIFEPCMSLLGLVVYGMLHPEPVNLFNNIECYTPGTWNSNNMGYYASQGNATRIFLWKQHKNILSRWRIVNLVRLSSISYVLSGGYSKKQLYPDRMYDLMRSIDRICDVIPPLFATRMLVVLEKVCNKSSD